MSKAHTSRQKEDLDRMYRILQDCMYLKGILLILRILLILSKTEPSNGKCPVV
jgi:hypothetical protein